MCSEAIFIFCPPCDCPTKMLCIFVGALFGGSKGGSSKSREQSLSHFVTAPFTQGSLWRREGMTTLPSALFNRRHLPLRGRQGKSACSPFTQGGLWEEHLLTPYTGRAMRKALAHPLHRGGQNVGDSFRPFGAPPSKREAREKRLLTPYTGRAMRRAPAHPLHREGYGGGRT